MTQPRVAGIGLLGRLFGESSQPHGQRDGQAAALEAHATGIGPTLAPADEARRPGAVASRRQRPLALPQDSLTESLAQKVLNAWLQNRHQTLYPLTVNLRTLDAAGTALLARMMALAMLASVRAPGAERVEVALAWLDQAGGDAEVARALRAALDAPAPLSTVLREVQDAGRLFLDYLAARLALPPNIVRSADRRYRR